MTSGRDDHNRKLDNGNNAVSGIDTAKSQDPLEHKNASVVADSAAIESLFRCWAGATDAKRPSDDVWVVELNATDVKMCVPGRPCSRTG